MPSESAFTGNRVRSERTVTALTRGNSPGEGRVSYQVLSACLACLGVS